MKITRTGARRNAGTSILATEDLTLKKDKKWYGPNWQPQNSELYFRSRNRDRNSTYDYELTFTPAEVILFAEVIVQGAIKDSTARAVGAGAVATLRELFSPQPKG